MSSLLERARGFLDEVRGGGTLARRFAMGSTAAFLVYLLGHGLAFLTQLLIARVLGANSYGIYAFVFACLSVLAYAAMLGFNIAILRFIPIYIASKAWQLLAGVIQYAERRVTAASLLLIMAGTMLVLIVGSEPQLELRNTFWIGFPLVLLWSIVWIRCAIVRAYGGVVSALVPIRVVREGFLFTFVCGLSLLHDWHGGAQLIMAATVAGSLLALIVATRTMHRLHPRELKGAVPEYDAPTWRAAAFPLVIVTAVEALFDKTGVLILGLAGNNESAGIYALVFNMAMLVVLPRTAIDTIFAPTIARLHAERKDAEVQALIMRASLLSFVVASCIALALAVVAGPLLSWFGPEFAAGAMPLRILLLGQLLAAGSGSQLLVMAMTGNESGAAQMLALSALANLLLCAAFVSLFGLIGAAIATAVALVAWNVLMAVDIWRKLQLWPGIFGVFRPAIV